MKQIHKINRCIVILCLAVFLLGSSVFGLAGCKKDDPSVTPTPPSETSPTPEEPDNYNPLFNKFGKSCEDWKKVGETQLSVNDKFLIIRGENAAAEKSWTLPDSNDLWVDFDYKPDGKNVTLKVEITIGEKTYLMADALPVRSTFGILNYQIPFNMHYATKDYANQIATLKISVGGAAADGGIQISNVRTYSRPIAGTVEETHDPLLNTFEKSMEDWYIGGHFDSLQHGYQLNSIIRYDNGKVLIDGSQMHGKKFTPNINTSMTKFFEMPEKINDEMYRMDVTVEASTTGTMIMVWLMADGKVIQATDGWLYVHSQQVNKISCVVPKGTKTVQPLIMQRDSNLNEGQGELALITGFAVTPYASDPYDNQFIADLEDWTDANAQDSAKKIKVDGGYAKLPNDASMSKTIAFKTQDAGWYQSIRLYFSTVGKIDVQLQLEVDGVKKTIYDETLDNQALGEVLLHEFEFEDGFSFLLNGKTGTFTLTTSNGSGAILNLGSFTLAKKWKVDPYNNQFQDGVEDWYNLTDLNSGWDGNKMHYDASWTRLQIDYGAAGTTLGRTVFEKKYTMLNSKKINLNFKLEGSGNNPSGFAGWYTMYLIVGDQTYTVVEKAGLHKEPTEINVKLDTIDALKNVDYAGKEVKVRFQLDQNPADNEMLAWMDCFVTTIYE